QRDGTIHAHRLGEADRRRVARLDQRVAHADDGKVGVVVVARLPDAAVAEAQLERLIGESLRRRHAGGDGAGVDEGLEGAAHLAPGILDAVEARVAIVATAYPREHVAGG